MAEEARDLSPHWQAQIRKEEEHAITSIDDYKSERLVPESQAMINTVLITCNG